MLLNITTLGFEPITFILLEGHLATLPNIDLTFDMLLHFVLILSILISLKINFQIRKLLYKF